MDDLNRRLNEAVEAALKGVRQIDAPVARASYCDDGQYPYAVYGLAHSLNDADAIATGIGVLTDHLIKSIAQTAADMVAANPGCAWVWRKRPLIEDNAERRIATFRAAMVPLHLTPETVEA